MDWIQEPQSIQDVSTMSCFCVIVICDHEPPRCSGWVHPCPVDTLPCKKGNML